MPRHLLTISEIDINALNGLANDAMSIGFEPMYPVQFLNNAYFMSLVLNQIEPSESVMNLSTNCPNLKKILGIVIENTGVQNILGCTEHNIYLSTQIDGVHVVPVDKLFNLINEIAIKNKNDITISIGKNSAPYNVIISRNNNPINHHSSGFMTKTMAYSYALETLYKLAEQLDIKRFDSI